jgi:hypothetical protein
MPPRPSRKETTAAEPLVPSREFFGTISELLKQIDPLSAKVERCAKAAPGVNELSRERDQRQEEFEATLSANQSQDVNSAVSRDSLTKQIEMLDAKISKRYRPFRVADRAVRKFAASVGEILDYSPTDPPEVTRIRSEIEQLVFWQMVAEPFTIPMRPAWAELQKIKFRFNEILECCRQQAGAVTPSSRQRRRRQIVNTLQAKLHCKTREDLEDHLDIDIDVSAVRAAIRGVRTHSGPAAEKKLLDACRKHAVDFQGWF